MKLTQLHTLVIGMSLILSGAHTFAQSTWEVDVGNCPGPGTGSAGDPFCSIQAGIDAAVNGDQVLVAPGTYNETINFDGKAITLRSERGPRFTIIDAAGLNDTVVRCISGEGLDTVLDGFTITGGYAPPDEGGGMFNLNASPTVLNCVFFSNIVNVGNPQGGASGGGMYNYNGSPLVVNCVFRANKVSGWGGGGGMANVSGSHPILINCTFYGNDTTQATDGGGAVLNAGGAECTIFNGIVWNNLPFGDGYPPQISGPATVSYSCVQGGWTGAGGVGNIDKDPRFVDADGADNVPGTLDDDLRLGHGSPCIDAGDNEAVPPDTADLDGDGDTAEPMPLDVGGTLRFLDDPFTDDSGNGVPPIVDMGAYEFDRSEHPIPAVSQWGVLVLALALLTGATVVMIRKRRTPPGVPTRVAFVAALIAFAPLHGRIYAQVRVGPQIRIDINGGTGAANETSMASSNAGSGDIVGAGQPDDIFLSNRDVGMVLREVGDDFPP